MKDPANDGYAYEGEFWPVDAEIDAEPGDVVLRVDLSDDASVGVVRKRCEGSGFIWWARFADGTGRTTTRFGSGEPWRPPGQSGYRR